MLSPALRNYQPHAALFGGEGLSAYAVLGFEPELVFDPILDYYRKAGAVTTFSDLVTHARASNATMVDSDGVLKWAPHNLEAYSDFSGGWAVASGTKTTGQTDQSGGTEAALLSGGLFTQNAAVVAGVQYTMERVAKAGTANSVTFGAAAFSANHYVSFNLAVPSVGIYSGPGFFNGSVESLGDGWVLCKADFLPTDTENTVVYTRCDGVAGADTGSFTLCQPRIYRSDLGGMVDNPDTGNSYVPTTSAARYLARRNHHIWNGSAWVNEGVLVESAAATNLLHTTGTLVTQSYTTTAVAHTLHFTGTGTVTLSGASTAGPLVGTGTGENNRVSLTFTPTAASLTMTVSGTVTNAMLEIGSVRSSYVPNLAGSGTVTRAAETLTIAGADMPYSATAMSFQMQGRMSYADLNAAGQVVFARWYADANNYIVLDLDTDGAATGEVNAEQAASATVDGVALAANYTAGVNVAYNIASRHTSSAINVAKDGTAGTANETPVALPALGSTVFQIGTAYNGTIGLVRGWDDNIGDAGLEGSTS